MVLHVCEVCGKEFNKKSSYNDHLNRKTPCKSPNDSQKSLANNETKFDLLIKTIEELRKDNDSLKQSQNEMKKEIAQLKELKKSINNTNNGKIVSHNDNSKNLYIVNVNAFGKENTNFIECKKAKEIIGKGYSSIPEYIKTLHFDELRPENHNVYLPNWRDKNRVLVFDGKSWNLKDKDDVIDDLKTKGIDFIQKYYSELNKNDKHDAQLLKKADRFLTSFNDEEKEKMDILNEDILLVLYNNRQIPEKTRKNKPQNNPK